MTQSVQSVCHTESPCFASVNATSLRELPHVCVKNAQRAGYAVLIVWWSGASFSSDTVSSVLGASVFRSLLGMAEGEFPGSSKAVAEWYLVEHQGYEPAFLIVVVLHAFAFLVILATLKRIGPIHSFAMRKPLIVFLPSLKAALVARPNFI